MSSISQLIDSSPFDDDDDDAVLKYLTKERKGMRLSLKRRASEEANRGEEDGRSEERYGLASFSSYEQVVEGPKVPLALDPIIHKSTQRRAYLVTYAHANMNKFATREQFANCVLKAFHNGESENNGLVKEWVCSLEPHTMEGRFHYHMAVNLTKSSRWIQVKDRISAATGAVVNFSQEGLGYAWACRYVVKTDRAPLFSDPHGDYSLINSQVSVKGFTSHSKKSAQQRQQHLEAAVEQPGQDEAGKSSATTNKSLGSKRVQVFPSMGRYS